MLGLFSGDLAISLFPFLKYSSFVTSSRYRTSIPASMTLRNQFLLRGILGLAVLWAIVFGVIKVAGSMKPTPERVIAFTEKNSLDTIEDPEKRRKVIGELADMLNQLEPDEVRELQERSDEEDGPPARRYFERMTPDEQLFFMEKRVGRAFQQMMESFNEMEREERKSIVERSLRQMKENGGRGPGPGLEDADPEIVDKITSAGLKAYYQDASAETKLDLAPLMEQMQHNISGRRGPPHR